MDMSSVTRNFSSNKALVIKSPRVNYHVLHLGGALDRRLNHEKPHWPIQLVVSVVA